MFSHVPENPSKAGDSLTRVEKLKGKRDLKTTKLLFHFLVFFISFLLLCVDFVLRIAYTTEQEDKRLYISSFFAHWKLYFALTTI